MGLHVSNAPYVFSRDTTRVLMLDVVIAMLPTALVGVWFFGLRALLHLVIAAVFLGVCLLGSLMLRTQMVQNSFESSQIETHITQLTQDVEDDQAKLDELDASLPSKAEEMGMVPQKGALTIDLNGYQANASGDKTR